VEFEGFIAALRREGHLFAEALDRADPDRRVPSCPDWTLRDLAWHTGAVHRWAAGYVAEARREYVAVELDEIVGTWPDDAHLREWFVDGHRALVDTLVASPEDLDCFTFLEAPTPRLMWSRRQAHETAIHRADAQSVKGDVTPYPPTFAADGIDELLSCFITRRARRPRTDARFTLRVQPEDVDRVWSVSVHPEGCETSREHREADVAVAGTASDLYLLVWNRLSASAVTVGGDASLLDRWREGIQVRWG
jgi:uncharacterized protein (TIGR03083 family)